MNIKGALRISLRASKKRGVANGTGHYCRHCQACKQRIGIYHSEFNRVTRAWGPTIQIQTAVVPCRHCRFIEFDDAWYDLAKALKQTYTGDYHSLTYSEPNMVLA